MFLIDKIFTAPFYGILKIFEEVYAAVQQEQQQAAENTMQELMELHRLLESGAISETEFDQREQVLLDKLDDVKNNE